MTAGNKCINSKSEKEALKYNKLTPEELEDVNGGVIADLLTHYRVCDDEDGHCIYDVRTYDEAVKLARECGVSTESLYKEDFYNRFPEMRP